MTVIVVFSHSIEWRCHYFSSTMCTRLPHVWCKTTYEARRVNSCWENAEYWRLRHSYLNLMLQRLIALISPKWGKPPWQQYGRWADEGHGDGYKHFVFYLDFWQQNEWEWSKCSTHTHTDSMTWHRHTHDWLFMHWRTHILYVLLRKPF